jgi:hypothetical protein
VTDDRPGVPRITAERLMQHLEASGVCADEAALEQRGLARSTAASARRPDSHAFGDPGGTTREDR